MNIKYICDYSLPDGNSENRTSVLSRENKGNYIVSSLSCIGINVDIISLSATKDRKYYSSRNDQICDRVWLISAPTLKNGNKVLRVLNIVYSGLWLIRYLIKNCQKDETVMVYHSVRKIPFLTVAKKIKKFKLCLEVEEIYADLLKDKSLVNSIRKKIELKFISGADCYIFASKELERRCNKKSARYATANGNYSIAPKLSSPSKDGKIHLVYAGLIKKDKAAFFCIDIASFLDAHYCIHIIGYGEDNDIADLRKLIDENNEACECRVDYCGELHGKNYSQFLQRCHIGICPLPCDQSYQSACFPSKISSYLANGLRVVTTENTTVRNSHVGEIIYYSLDDKPESFARIIEKINIDDAYDSRYEIEKENTRFIMELKRMIRNA